MALLQNCEDLYVNECERKPNRYAANMLGGIVAVLALVCAINELGVFTLNLWLVRTCFFASLASLTILQAAVRSARFVQNPRSKFFVMALVLALVMMLSVLLNIHALLALVLPLLLATQYRSHALSIMAVVGACFCCTAAPIISYLLGTWDLQFMTGYIQAFCRITIVVIPGNALTVAETIHQIWLFWSLPQVLTLCSFGLILRSVTKSGMSSVRNQAQVVALSRDLKAQLQSTLSMQEKILISMSDIIETRDTDTGGHVKRTSEVVRLLMDAVREGGNRDVTEEFCSIVVLTAPMHDLGKIAIPDAILQKPGRLTAEEYAVVRGHPAKSAEIIERVLTGVEDEQLLTVAKNIALYHHERVDGTGYPARLKGDEIPLEARVMAIADVYDALVSERSYKAPMSFDEAFETIETAMGTQFDEDLNPYFIARRGEIEAFYRS